MAKSPMKPKNKPWEVPYKSDLEKDSKSEQGAQWNPKPPSERLKTYKKVNDQDH